MNNLKCPNCGADISTETAQTSGKCDYCNTRFAAEKKAKPIYNSTTEINKSVRPTEPRPRLNFGLLLILFLFGGPLFVGYIILVEIRKKAWDSKYATPSHKNEDNDFSSFDRY